MRRVLVLGCCGAGKSTLARQLGRRLDLPVINLDAHYWGPGWTPMEDHPWRETVARLVAEPAWVMDGNFKGTLDLRLPRADTVLWLAPGRLRCMVRVLGRVARWWGRVRPDMADGCPERLDLDFLRYVWTFDRRISPLVEDAIRQHFGAGQRWTLTDAAAVADFLAGSTQASRPT